MFHSIIIIHSLGIWP